MQWTGVQGAQQGGSGHCVQLLFRLIGKYGTALEIVAFSICYIRM
jgi:hypothetical protein